MTRILHISDTHFGTQVPSVVEALWQAVAEIQPTVVVHSGDVTQRALASEFEQAAVFFGKFEGVPRLVVPGNHDIPLWDLMARVLRPYAGFKRTFDELEPSYEDADTLILSLNTTRAWRHKHGTSSKAQVARVRERVRAAAPQKLRIVVAHHPLFIPPPYEQYDQMRGNRVAARAWSEAGVDLVLGGHIHLPYFMQLPAGFAAPFTSCWVAQAGTALSRRTRRGVPNSFNVIRRESTFYTLERWDYLRAQERFALSQTVQVSLLRPG